MQDVWQKAENSANTSEDVIVHSEHVVNGLPLSFNTDHYVTEDRLQPIQHLKDKEISILKPSMFLS